MIKLEVWQFILGILILVLGPGGAAYFSVKASLNGFKFFVTEKLTSITEELKDIRTKQMEHGELIAVLKTRTEIEED